MIHEVMALADEPCDLCGQIVPQEDAAADVIEMTGMLICTSCLEHLSEQEIAA